MHVKIVGFKCHIDSEYSFSNGEITLLKGPSGVGKSTILQAIYWCLYGNMRSIYNNAGITKKLSVTLYLPEITIHRKKNPELLQVTIGEQTFEDKIGQSLINNKLGEKELWRACSYIEQKSRCSLVSGSSNERMTLLNSLSFTGENPKECIKKISENLKQVNGEFLLKQQELTTESNIYQGEISEKPIILTLSEVEISQLSENIETLSEGEKDLHQKFIEQERIVGSYNYLKSQINVLSDKLMRLSSEEITQITYEEYNCRKSKLQNDIKNLQTLIPKLEKKDNLTKELNKILEQIEKVTLPNNVEEIPPITQQDIWKIETDEKNRNIYLQQCNKLNVEYDLEVIKKTITDLSQKLTTLSHLERHLDNYNKLLTLEKKISSLSLNSDPTNSDIEKLEKLNRERNIQISDLKKGLELLSCPKCSTPLRYINKQLIIGDRPPTSESQIEKVQEEYLYTARQISKIREYLSLRDNANIIRNTLEGIQLEQLESGTNIKSQISQISQWINSLSQIKYIEVPQVDSQTLTNIYNYRKLFKTKNELEEQISLLGDVNGNMGVCRENLVEHNNTLSQLENNYRAQQEVKSNLSNISGALAQHKKEVKDMEDKLDPTIRVKYNESKKMLEESKLKLEQALWGSKCRKKEEVIRKKGKIVDNLYKDVKALEKLKQVAVEIECKQLEDTVENINNVLETTLPIFFPESISMKLCLFKTLKAKKQVKPGLNLEIMYKGVKYDNINFLSGGEGDRLSLALLLALNSVSNSPVIMLDECVSSLDSNLKESCVEAIKNIPDKTIICVDHEGVEGFYDSVIELF